MTIYDYLKKDHDQIKDLMNEIVELGDNTQKERNELFNSLKKKLILHSKAEEKTFYNPLKKFKATKDEVVHGQEEHHDAEMLLEELTDSSLEGAAWMQKFKKLKNTVEHHIEEEENDIFKDAHKVLDEKTAEEMEVNMKEQKQIEKESRNIEKRHAA